MLNINNLIGFGVGGGADYPNILGATSGNSASTSSVAVTFPSGGSAGDLILVFIQQRDDRSVTDPANWQRLYYLDSGNIAGYAAYFIATGSDGSQSFSLSGSTAVAWNCYRIKNYTGVPEISSIYSGTTQFPNPPALSPSWGTKKNLWLAFTGARSSSAATLPSGYSDKVESFNTTNAVLASSGRLFNTNSSDNPGAFSLSASGNAQAYTICVQGK